MDIIFYKGGSGGGLGHSYYEAPEVRSDIVMLGQGHRAGVETSPNIAEIYILDDRVRLVLEDCVGNLGTF